MKERPTSPSPHFCNRLTPQGFPEPSSVWPVQSHFNVLCSSSQSKAKLSWTRISKQLGREATSTRHALGSELMQVALQGAEYIYIHTHTHTHIHTHTHTYTHTHYIYINVYKYIFITYII